MYFHSACAGGKKTVIQMKCAYDSSEQDSPGHTTQIHGHPTAMLTREYCGSSHLLSLFKLNRRTYTVSVNIVRFQKNFGKLATSIIRSVQLTSFLCYQILSLGPTTHHAWAVQLGVTLSPHRR